VIPPGKGAAFVQSLPVSRFHGVGPVTAAKMERLGIHTGADLHDRDLPFLQTQFGSYAEYLHRAARGEDNRPVRAHRISKSIGAERTFDTNIADEAELAERLAGIADAAWVRIERHRAQGRTVTLKLRHPDFTTITRAKSFADPVRDRDAFLAAGRSLLAAQLPAPNGIRLLGLTLSGLGGAGTDPQPTLPL
jgi:DNA polymerase-4